MFSVFIVWVMRFQPNLHFSYEFFKQMWLALKLVTAVIFLCFIDLHRSVEIWVKNCALRSSYSKSVKVVEHGFQYWNVQLLYLQHFCVQFMLFRILLLKCCLFYDSERESQKLHCPLVQNHMTMLFQKTRFHEKHIMYILCRFATFCLL